MKINNKKNEKINHLQSHRKSSELNSQDSLTADQWEECKKYFDYSCAYCGIKPKFLCKDHFIPLNFGGSLTIDNVIPCCSSCNSSKSNRKFHVWYRTAPFYSHVKEAKIHEYLNKNMNSKI